MTANSKHTPGPWSEQWVRPDKARGHTFDPTCAIVATDPKHGRIRVADVPDPMDAESEANARLIAAAPELLVACEVARDAIRIIEEHHGSESSNTRLMLEAAITKATEVQS